MTRLAVDGGSRGGWRWWLVWSAVYLLAMGGLCSILVAYDSVSDALDARFRFWTVRTVGDRIERVSNPRYGSIAAHEMAVFVLGDGNGHTSAKQIDAVFSGMGRALERVADAETAEARIIARRVDRCLVYRISGSSQDAVQCGLFFSVVDPGLKTVFWFSDQT